MSGSRPPYRPAPDHADHGLAVGQAVQVHDRLSPAHFYRRKLAGLLVGVDQPRLSIQPAGGGAHRGQQPQDQEPAGGERKASCPSTAWLSIRPSDKGDGVFWGLRGPLTESGIYQMIRRVAETEGIEGRFNPHSFRRGWARGALWNGADINDVSHVLGHSSIFVTSKFYGCWRDEQLKQVHDQVSWLPDEG